MYDKCPHENKAPHIDTNTHCATTPYKTAVGEILNSLGAKLLSPVRRSVLLGTLWNIHKCSLGRVLCQRICKMARLKQSLSSAAICAVRSAYVLGTEVPVREM